MLWHTYEYKAKYIMRRLEHKRSHSKNECLQIGHNGART